MKILITGVNGLVGSAIAKALSAGNEIFGIGRKNQSIIPCIDYLQGDIGEKDTVCRINKHWEKHCFDALVHCAAEISEDGDKLYQTNCYGTQNLADYAAKSGCRVFIYISSIPVIGKPTTLPITEEHEVWPSTIYHRTKYLGEIILDQTLREKCNYKILRIGSPLGRTISDKKIVGAFLKSCREGHTIDIWGSGNRMQNYIDVRDVARAVQCAVDTGTDSGLYLISGHNVTDRDLASLCQRVCQSKNDILIQNPNKESEERWEIDGKKALLGLGYKPEYSLRQTLEWILQAQTENEDST